MTMGLTEAEAQEQGHARLHIGLIPIVVVVINVYICVCVCVLSAVRIDAAIIQINFETKACRLFVSFRNVTKQLLAARSCVVRRN